jgi:hypothetical protein
MQKYKEDLAHDEEAGNTMDETEYPEYLEDGSQIQDIRDQETERDSPSLGSGTSTPKNVSIPLDNKEHLHLDFFASYYLSISLDADLFDPFLQILFF